MDPIAAALDGQFARILHTLADAIGHFDDAGLRTGTVDFLIPARMAYHVLGSVDFYTEPAPNRAFINKLGGNWEHSPVNELPSKQQLLAYIVELRSKITNYLSSQTTESLLSAEKNFPWTGQSILERLIYAARHAQHHVGQINAELRNRGLPRGEWA